ncbi:MAG TPA: restriction endonuclease subunit S [Bryobacteraceae bacterium]|nr:restriction endonuclease subunit S [Bryobacteraceae bacterium]
MVPDHWNEAPLGKLVERVIRPVTVEPNGLYQEIGIRSHGKGLFDKEPVRGFTLGDKRVFWVEPNCLVVNIVFAWEQAVGKTTEKDQGKIASHRFPMFRPRPGRSDIDYLVYLFKTPYGKHLLNLASPGGAGRNKTLGQNDFLKTIVRVPPFHEQIAIVRLLKTWERAIATVEGLIENGDMGKRALTQKLITGNERFRGFASTPWREITLKDIADIRTSNVDKKTDAGQIAVQLCNYTDVYYNRHITKGLSFMNATATQSEIERFTLQKGDVVITKDSESPEDIAVPALIDEDLDGVLCGYHLALIRPRRNQADGEFLSNLFSLKKTQNYFFTHANGVTRFGLSIDTIREAAFRIPGIEEQRRVAAVLRTSEQSISKYKKQLVALKEQRTALMQQLLTGKLRVASIASKELARA